MTEARIDLTLVGNLPEGVQVGDELTISGTITVHSITTDLVDVSGRTRRAYLPGHRDIHAYANEITFERPTP